jgi:hypothetical protein
LLESDLAREDEELREMKTIHEILRDLKKSLEANLPQLQEQAKAVQQKARKITTERPVIALVPNSPPTSRRAHSCRVPPDSGSERDRRRSNA